MDGYTRQAEDGRVEAGGASGRAKDETKQGKYGGAPVKGLEFYPGLLKSGFCRLHFASDIIVVFFLVSAIMLWKRARQGRSPGVCLQEHHAIHVSELLGAAVLLIVANLMAPSLLRFWRRYGAWLLQQAS